MQIVMIQDKIVPIEQVHPVYFDRGIYFGDGVYEVLRSYDGKIFALREHLERFANSLTAIDITGVSLSDIRSRVLEAFSAAAIENAKIYFHITRGSAPREHTWEKNLTPNFFLTITELPDQTQLKEKGIAVCTHPDWRWKRCDIKSLNLLANVLARQTAAKKRCDETILVDETGHITEGAGSAFFAVFGKNLQTAPLTGNILPSITRRFVLQAARDIEMNLVEKPLTRRRAANADELFIAVTTKDIVGVVKFDNKIIGSGKPGKYTKLLTHRFHTFTR